MIGLYKRIEALCKQQGETITDMCRNADVPRGNLTDLKMGRQKGLSSKNTGKLAEYLGVPADFLLDVPPFDCWELIDQNRKGFLHYVDISPDSLRVLWGIDSKDPDSCSIKNFVSFLHMAVESARPTEDGDWEIELKEAYKKKPGPRPWFPRR